MIGTTRRASLSAAFVAGVSPSMLANAVYPGVKLRELVKKLDRLWKVKVAISAEILPPGITPESEDWDDRLEEAISAWDCVADQIAETPARSPCELLAKAHALQKVIVRTTFVELDRSEAEQIAEANIEVRLAWTLAADIINSPHIMRGAMS